MFTITVNVNIIVKYIRAGTTRAGMLIICIRDRKEVLYMYI